MVLMIIKHHIIMISTLQRVCFMQYKIDKLAQLILMLLIISIVKDKIIIIKRLHNLIFYYVSIVIMGA